MAPVTNRHRIIYGTSGSGTELTIGAATGYQIIGNSLSIQESRQRFTVSVDILVQDNTATTFETMCSTLESRVILPSLRLRVSSGATWAVSMADFDPEATDGMIIAGEAVFDPTRGVNTLNSRLYTVVWTGIRPAETEAAHQYKCTYGSLTLGTGTSYEIMGDSIKLSDSYETFSASIQVLIRIANEANLATAVKALQDGIRIPYVRLTLLSGAAFGNTVFDFDPGNSSGIQTKGECILDPTFAQNSLTTRIYTLNWTGTRPATQTGHGGRRNSNMRIGEDTAGRRTITLNGEWTSVNTTSAQFTFDSNYPAYEAAVLTSVGGVFNRTSLETFIDQDAETAGPADPGGTILQYSSTYVEVLLDATDTIVADATILNPSIRVSRIRSGPPSSLLPTSKSQITGARGIPLQKLSVNFTCSLDKSITEYADIRSKWETVIRPYIISHLKLLTGASNIAITSENWDPDKSASTVSADLQASAAFAGQLLASSFSVSDRGSDPITIIPVWNGNAYGYKVFSSPGVLTRTVILQRTEVGENPRPILPKTTNVKYFDDPSGGGLWVRTNHERSVPYRGKIGLPDATINTATIVESATYRFINTDSASSSGISGSQERTYGDNIGSSPNGGTTG